VTDLTPERFQQHASSFDRAADVYERARPSYPADAVDWLLESIPATSVDLGAGTGKFTRLIADRTRVIAIDPSEKMLAHIDGETHIGTGEAIPLPDHSVDAVFAAQAWHWVDPVRGSNEVARVLKPGGTLGLIWNARDDREPWIAEMSRIIHDGPSAELKELPPTLGDQFGEIEFFETAWTHELERDEIAELVASRSHFIIQDAASQASVLRELRGLLDTHPDTKDLLHIPVPYRTFAYRAATLDLPQDKGAAHDS
jgi:SAM-dependent methyltransferase